VTEPVKLQARTVDDPSAQLNFEQLVGLFPLAGALLAAGSVDASHLAPNAVDAAALADDAVDAAALASGAIMDGRDLRIVAGCVSSAGADLFGIGGFSVAHNATGKWTITLSTPFADGAYVTLLTCFNGPSGIGIASLRTDVSYTASQFGVHTINSTSFADLTFMFACLGKR